MIKFTDLKVQNGHLIINAEVMTLENYFDNVYIKSISIDTQDTYTENGPSESTIYNQTFTGEPTSISLDITKNDFSDTVCIDMDKTMFFVYIEADGTPSPLTPCGMDNTYTLGVTFSHCPIYNATMRFVKEIENTCELPKNFINDILQLKAIQYSINSKHYEQAIKYYNKFYKHLSKVHINGCGCNG